MRALVFRPARSSDRALRAARSLLVCRPIRAGRSGARRLRRSEPGVRALRLPLPRTPVARFRLRLAVPDMPLAALIVELIPSRRLFAAVLTFLGWLLTPGLLC